MALRCFIVQEKEGGAGIVLKRRETLSPSLFARAVTEPAIKIPNKERYRRTKEREISSERGAPFPRKIRHFSETCFSPALLPYITANMNTRAYRHPHRQTHVYPRAQKRTPE